ncbi:sulfurtransferase [Thermaurantimonas aggregans]|uniref:Sulfurtransferase n=1 Tax=Thermaurantimonas aggregans TaxID=2173829 RepID=A0A401XLW7_9FLAO|nr:rhodanese-like domain-containing protein [Thermaurantimonas aggregans]MCX8149535.1 rhodanese-like domain-containing protein [Thermaurantimonas aggregans]GCD77988.1 sulfurtransferase [Thermaurantimonas aggregans]
MGFFDLIFRKKVDFKALKEKGAIIIDVRTPAEYASGHIKGSRNIPLDQISKYVNELKIARKPVITCCRSGARSGAAANILKANGIEAYNGGPWDSLKAKI